MSQTLVAGPMPAVYRKPVTSRACDPAVDIGKGPVFPDTRPTAL
jgi:hypothetical protein